MTGRGATIQGDTGIHVAQFLQEPVGATRQVRLALDHLPLDDDLDAREVTADLRLTRIPSGILVKGPVAAVVSFECIRCLETFEEPIQAEVADEYRPTVDVLTGVELPAADAEEAEEEYFAISGLHVLDVRESLRQALVLVLPMAPLCREECPGLPEAAALMADSDDRLTVLAQLLGDGADDGADERGVPADEQRRARSR